MPHFIIHCSKGAIANHDVKKIVHLVHDTADGTGLFAKGNIKARIQTFDTYTVGGGSDDFMHIFGYIMSGRTTEQKAELSRAIITALKPLFPELPVLSINIDEFDKATYCNKSML